MRPYPLVDASSKGSKVELEGTEQVDGRDAYKLKVTTGKDVRRVWVDAESFLDVKVDDSRRIEGKQRQVFTFLREYKAVNGVMVPSWRRWRRASRGWRRSSSIALW